MKSLMGVAWSTADTSLTRRQTRPSPPVTPECHKRGRVTLQTAGGPRLRRSRSALLSGDGCVKMSGIHKSALYNDFRSQFQGLSAFLEVS